MTVLKGIPRILPPRLLYILASMGHGDELVLADANFPAAATAAAEPTAEWICCDGLTVPVLLQAILQLMPLDTYVTSPAAVMQVTPQDQGRVETPIWEEFKRIMKAAQG